MQVQYIGTQDTKVRVGGVKIDVAPGEIFEMEEAEGLLLINGPYRNFYIQEGAELTEKQNPDNNKFPPQTIIGKEIEALKQPQEEEKTNVIPEVAHILARIHTAQTIDVLNEVSTDVANEDILSENEEIVKAIEEKMQEFLNETQLKAPTSFG